MGIEKYKMNMWASIAAWLMCISCNILINKGGDNVLQAPNGQHTSWKQYGGSADQSKYVDFRQIIGYGAPTCPVEQKGSRLCTRLMAASTWW